MPCAPSGQEPATHFALVAYIQDPLRKFLDDLRRELVPGCAPHAHITILPPRPLTDSPDAAIAVLRSRAPEFPPFQITIGAVEVFKATDVIYLSVAEGEAQLRQMHAALNVGPLGYTEQFAYHPHITLAQDLTHEQSVELEQTARRRWAEFKHSRSFPVESLVFVQSSARNLWTDLAYFQLDPAPSIRR